MGPGDRLHDREAETRPLVGQRIGTLDGAAFATGSGSGQPQGLVPNVTAVTAATGSATRYTLADIVSVYKAVPAAYRSRSTWIVHPDDFANLASLADTAGGLVLPSLQTDAPSLFGRPVELDANLAAPAANAKSLIFGDIATAYTIRRVSACRGSRNFTRTRGSSATERASGSTGAWSWPTRRAF